MDKTIEATSKLESRDKMKKRAISIEQKLDIAEKLENGVPVRQLGFEYGIHPATVRWIRRKISTLRCFSTQGVHARKRKRIRKPPHHELEERLNAWYLERRALGETATDQILQMKAQELIQRFAGTPQFKASMGWVAKFKRRYNIRLVCTETKQKPQKNMAGVEKYPSFFTCKVEKENLPYESAYAIDETSPTWSKNEFEDDTYEKSQEENEEEQEIPLENVQEDPLEIEQKGSFEFVQDPLGNVNEDPLENEQKGSFEFVQESQENAQGESEEDARREELEKAFGIIAKYSEHEPQFIRLTISNLREHFLRRQD